MDIFVRWRKMLRYKYKCEGVINGFVFGPEIRTSLTSLKAQLNHMAR